MAAKTNAQVDNVGGNYDYGYNDNNQGYNQN